MFIISVIFIPVSFIQWHCDYILKKFGIEPEVAETACMYVSNILPAALLNSFNEAIELFLIPLGYTYSICLIQALIVPFHIVFVYVFLNKMGLGLRGVAYAHNLTASLTFFFICTYLTFQPKIKEAWYWPTRKTFENLNEFLKLAVPGVMMMLLENSNM